MFFLPGTSYAVRHIPNSALFCDCIANTAFRRFCPCRSSVIRPTLVLHRDFGYGCCLPFRLLRSRSAYIGPLLSGRRGGSRYILKRQIKLWSVRAATRPIMSRMDQGEKLKVPCKIAYITYSIGKKNSSYHVHRLTQM